MVLATGVLGRCALKRDDGSEGRGFRSEATGWVVSVGAGVKSLGLGLGLELEV